jgi:hypothetical protein
MKNVKVGENIFKIYGTIIIVLGDNLGLHAVLCIKGSKTFSNITRICRICFIARDELNEFKEGNLR